MKCDRFHIIARKGNRKIFIIVDKDGLNEAYQDYVAKRINNLQAKGYEISEPQFCGGRIKAEIKTYDYNDIDFEYRCETCKNHYFRNLPHSIEELQEILQNAVDNMQGAVEFNEIKKPNENDLYNSRINADNYDYAADDREFDRRNGR